MTPDLSSLDRQVAERVMGWQHPKGGFDVTPGGNVIVLDGEGLSEWWSPSTDIAAAWDVVERMRERGFGFVLCVGAELGLWRANFYGPDAFPVEDTSPCIAICRAALAAVGETQ